MSVKKWGALIVLAMAQFLMVLDQAVMNVSISQLVEDFDTSVTTIQAVITMYSLVMATLMVTGAKVGDIIGRRRAFTIGHVIYGAGSALTAASWSVGSLLVGWSFLEGIGAALVLPALVALIAATYEGRDRVAAFGVIGGVSGVGIAAGPIIGGYFTTELSWRWVFVGEVIVAAVIVATARTIADAPLEGRRPRLDWVGSVLTAVGLGMIVIAVLQASSWGWIKPKSSPIEPFGFSLTPFVVVGGFVVLGLFVAWEERRARRGQDTLVNLGLFKVLELRSGLASFLAQNTILLGIFFALPLYLQIVLGFDALDTGIRMLPISIAMFLTSAIGPTLARRLAPRLIVQGGFVMLVIAAFFMIQTIEPDLRGFAFGVSLTLLGIGMGLVASQLGNVIQSSVGPRDRGEAGGLQYTAQQLGSSLGTALIGAIVITALVTAFVDNIESDERVSSELADAIQVEIGSDASFVTADAVDQALREAGVDEATTSAVVEDYEEAQLDALKAGLLLAGFIAVGALVVTRNLPAERLGPERAEHVERVEEGAA
jgi:EmrB/QacA subfamily drug resistance transporter